MLEALKREPKNVKNKGQKDLICKLREKTQGKYGTSLTAERQALGSQKSETGNGRERWCESTDTIRTAGEAIRGSTSKG